MFLFGSCRDYFQRLKEDDYDLISFIFVATSRSLRTVDRTSQTYFTLLELMELRFNSTRSVNNDNLSDSLETTLLLRLERISNYILICFLIWTRAEHNQLSEGRWKGGNRFRFEECSSSFVSFLSYSLWNTRRTGCINILQFICVVLWWDEPVLLDRRYRLQDYFEGMRFQKTMMSLVSTVAPLSLTRFNHKWGIRAYTLITWDWIITESLSLHSTRASLPTSYQLRSTKI